MARDDVEPCRMRYKKPPSRMPGRRMDFAVATAEDPSTKAVEGAAACQAAMSCSSSVASNCSSSVDPERAVIELVPPVTAWVTASK